MISVWKISHFCSLLGKAKKKFLQNSQNAENFAQAIETKFKVWKLRFEISNHMVLRFLPIC